MKLARLICVTAMLASAALAQSHGKNRAVLSGVVVDVTGAVIPGAKVTLQGHGSRTSMTDGEGNFAFSDLPQGWYSLRVEKKVFKTANLKGINIEKPKRYDVRVLLEAEKIVDWIVLTDDALTIDTTSSSPHNCTTDSEMQSVPMDRSVAGAISVAGRCP